MARPGLPALRRLWRLPPFTAYLITVSGWFFSFGLQMTLFPGVINYTLNETPDRLGLAQAALTAPMLLLLPLTGVLAERIDRRGVLSVFHLTAAAGAFGLAALLLAGQLSYGVLIAYALIVGVASAFVLPARDSAVNDVARIAQRMGRPDFSLQRAVVLTSLTQFAAQIVGMGLGFLAGTFGPGPLFAAQGVGLAIGGLTALLMPRLHSRKTMHDRVWPSLLDGLRAVSTSPILLPMTLIMVAVGILVVGGGFFVIVPVLVRDSYGAGYGVLSSLLVSFWVGAFAANIVLARLGNIERPGRALLGAQVITVAGLGALAFALPLPVLYLLIFGWGVGAGIAISLSRAIVQEHAPPGKVARVLSVYQLGLFGGMPVGALVMGYVVSLTGPHLASLIPMAGLMLVLAWIALATPILNVRRAEPG